MDYWDVHGKRIAPSDFSDDNAGLDPGCFQRCRIKLRNDLQDTRVLPHLVRHFAPNAGAYQVVVARILLQQSTET